MNRRKNEKSFSILFIMVVAVALVVVLGIIVLLIYLFNLGELLEIYIDQDLRWFVILIWIVSSITVGLGVSMWFGQIIMKPVNRMIKGMTQLSDGIYDTKIYIGKRNALKDLSECFNKLALELKKHDSMSNDFINNFSHELKTPLVSISGLIKLLQDENVSEEKKKLVQVTKECFFEAIKGLKEGSRLGDIGARVQRHAEKHGYSVVRVMVGHGIGTKMHEDPQIPNFGTEGTGIKLKAGNTLAIEPMINMGSYELKLNGWDARTIDGQPSAHYENTVLICSDGVEILTKI